MKLRLKVYKRGSKCLHGGEINGRFYFHFIDVEEIFQKLLMTAESSVINGIQRNWLFTSNMKIFVDIQNKFK